MIKYFKWMQVDARLVRATSLEIFEAYVEQWTSSGLSDDVKWILHLEFTVDYMSSYSEALPPYHFCLQAVK